MEISNNGAMNYFAQAARTQGTAKASAAQLAAHAPASNANVAATTKAGNSNFTPTEAVQKEAEKWESFAAETLSEMEYEMNHYNHMKNLPDSYWAQFEEIGGPEMVARVKAGTQESMSNVKENLAAMQQSLVDNDFNISGTLYQKNDLGEFGFGDFEISKKGVGYQLLFNGPNDREIEYTRGRGRAPNVLVDNKLQDLLFKESRR